MTASVEIENGNGDRKLILNLSVWKMILSIIVLSFAMFGSVAAGVNSVVDGKIELYKAVSEVKIQKDLNEIKVTLAGIEARLDMEKD